MRLLTICGSLQDGSANAALLDDFAASIGATGTVVPSVAIGDLPHFRPDLPDPGDAVDRFRADVAAADAVVIATPEYAHSFPGSLKNALDWLVGSGEMYEKPVAVVSAVSIAERGARGRTALVQPLLAMGCTVVDVRAVVGASATAVAEVIGLLRDAVAQAPPGLR